jgi:hypothetical protein
VVNTFNYYPLATEKHLNQFAKASGVQLLLQMHASEPLDAEYADERLTDVIKKQVDRLNAMPDSDAVVGWMISDEIEELVAAGANPPERGAKAQRNLQRIVELVRQIDPVRRTATNHGGLPWMTVHEDEPFCSTGFTTRLNAYKVADRVAEAQRQGYPSYFLVSQASACPRGIPNLRYYGYREPITDAVLDSFTIAQEIQDHAEVAYLHGATGVMYFLYWAGGANYQPFTLTDVDGNDYQGKWEAVRKAARNIRQWEGAPSCRITQPDRASWATLGKVDKNAWWIADAVKVVVDARASEDHPVRAVKADYSFDGGLTWKPLPEATAEPYRFAIARDSMPKDRKEVRRTIRARAVNDLVASLWDVTEVHLRIAANKTQNSGR